jgi:amidophosphoribosyltransferase
MLFDARASEVHVRVSSPPVISPCFYGIDLASPDEMIAANNSVEGVREAIGATSLAYLSLVGLQAATRRPPATLCRACLTGEYPTRVPSEHGKLRFEPGGSSDRGATGSGPPDGLPSVPERGCSHAPSRRARCSS